MPEFMSEKLASIAVQRFPQATPKICAKWRFAMQRRPSGSCAPPAAIIWQSAQRDHVELQKTTSGRAIAFSPPLLSF
jgi:hypothetical protein